MGRRLTEGITLEMLEQNEHYYEDTGEIWNIT